MNVITNEKNTLKHLKILPFSLCKVSHFRVVYHVFMNEALVANGLLRESFLEREE